MMVRAAMIMLAMIMAIVRVIMVMIVVVIMAVVMPVVAGAHLRIRDPVATLESSFRRGPDPK